MKLGLFAINIGATATDPGGAIRVARAAEESGWESVWTGEHPVLPDPAVPSSPALGATPILDPFVTLAAIAANTSTLLLATGVTIVPLHQPLRLAKSVASLDVLSGGRVLFGVGVGYLEPEFAAMGVDLAQRATLTDDYLDAIEAIWAGGSQTFTGRHASFAGVRAEPLPVQRPSPPIHVGGYVDASFRRAVRRGHGWYGFDLDLDQAACCLDQLRAELSATERAEDLGTLEISVTPSRRLPLDEETVARFAELGVDRLIVLPDRSARDTMGLASFVRTTAERLSTVIAA